MKYLISRASEFDDDDDDGGRGGDGDGGRRGGDGGQDGNEEASLDDGVAAGTFSEMKWIQLELR